MSQLSLVIALGFFNYFLQAQRVNNICSSGQFWSGQTCVSCATPSIGYCECSSYLGCDSIICPTGYLALPAITGIQNMPVCVLGCGYSCLSCGIAQGSVVCFKCAPGYQLVANLCAPIENDECVSYSGLSGLCTKCPQGMYLQFYDAVSYCSYCSIPGCATCPSANTCTSCESGYYLNNTLEASQMCQECPSFCATCNWNSTCLQCEPQYYLDTDGNCQSCQLVGGGVSCIACTSNTCTACNYGSYLANGNVCIACSVSNCLYCTSTQCLVCSDGYLLSNQQCLSCSTLEGCQYQQCGINSVNGQLICYQCSNGYYLNQYGQCQYCSDWNPNVLYCAGQYDNQNFTTLTATQCQQGYNLIQLSGVNTCVQNTISNCMSLYSSTNCSICYPPYTPINSTCQICQSSCTNCVVNNKQNSLSCTSCISGYYLSSGSCQPCPSKCSQCTSSTCKTCQSGYILINETCQSCNQANCDSCPQSGYCTTCLPGYFSAAGQCYQCAAGCTTCKYPGQDCLTCQSGYILVNGGCLLYQGQQNCIFFDVHLTMCLLCEYGYYLNRGFCLNCIGQQSNFVCRQNIVASNQFYIQN